MANLKELPKEVIVGLCDTYYKISHCKPDERKSIYGQNCDYAAAHILDMICANFRLNKDCDTTEIDCHYIDTDICERINYEVNKKQLKEVIRDGFYPVESMVEIKITVRFRNRKNMEKEFLIPYHAYKKGIGISQLYGAWMAKEGIESRSVLSWGYKRC